MGSSQSEIAPPKLCECGCGSPAPISSKTRAGRGQVKGQPVRFILGHSYRGRGKPHSPEHSARIAAAKRGKPRPDMLGERNKWWKGDECGYIGMHRRAGQVLPRECLYCGNAEGRLEVALRHDGSPSARRFGLNGRTMMVYSIKTADYIRLCPGCHHEYDRRAVAA